MICDLTRDLSNVPLDPSNHIALLQMRYSANILQEKFATFQGLDWFNPEVTVQELTNNPEIGQSLRIRYEVDENPYEKVQVEDVTYVDGETCPPRIDISCAPGCISTAPSWTNKDILYDKKYTVGASWCVETERLTYGDLDTRFRKSIDANNQLQSINGWNQLICKAIADPASTLIPSDANCFPVHYIQAGSAVTNGYDVLTTVIAYMKAVFGSETEYGIFAHRYLETDLIGPGSALHNYANTGVPTAWGNKDTLVQGGWKPMPSLPGGLWGEQILIAPDSKYLYTGSGLSAQNHNPFMSADGTKYYVLIASRRSFLSGVTPLMDPRLFPATCDNKNESLQASFLGFNDVLFPKELFVIEFDVDCAGSLGSLGSI